MNSFFTSEATLPFDAPSYVERRADKDLYEALLQGDYCYVLTSRQMGKSSLMGRAAQRLRQRGVCSVTMDLTAYGQSGQAEHWYFSLAERVGEQAKEESLVERSWQNSERLPPVQRFFRVISDLLHADSSRRLAIFIDEIDTVLSFKSFSADEFFAAIRECYVRRVEDPAFQRVTFCLLGVATPSDLIQDTRTTPFNVAQRITLDDFTAAEAAPYAAVLHESLKEQGMTANGARALLRRVLHWTGGHPYLTQRLCKELCDPSMHRKHIWMSLFSRCWPARLADVGCRDVFFIGAARTSDNNLDFVRDRLLRAKVDQEALLTLYGDVVRGRRVEASETSACIDVLRLAGVVRVKQGRLHTRNRIYKGAFDWNWARQNMPDAARRAQERAVRNGVIRTASIAAGVIFLLGGLTYWALQSASAAREREAQSHYSEARSLRKGRQAGRQVDAMEALRKAEPHYHDRSGLRYEVIATLAQLDLWQEPVGDEEFTLGREETMNPRMTHSGWSDAEGKVRISPLGSHDASAQRLLPAVGLQVAWMAISPDGNLVAVQYGVPGQGRFIVWEADTERRVVDLEGHVPSSAIDFNEAGTVLAFAYLETPGRSVLRAIALPDGRELLTRSLLEETGILRVPTCLRLDPSGRFLAESSGSSYHVSIWDLSLGERDRQLYHRGEVVAMAWSEDGQQLATASDTHSIYVWYLPMKTRQEISKAHSGPILDLAFSGDGNLLGSVSEDMSLKLWIPANKRA